MESYIVHIYRRSTDDPQEIAGLVEIVEIDTRKAFNTFDELRMIINNKTAPERTSESTKGKKCGENL